MKYNIAYSEGEPVSVSLFVGDKPYIANKEHPNFERILDAIKDTSPMADDAIAALFDIGESVVAGFADTVLSRRIMLVNRTLMLDGDPVEGPIADTIVTFYTEGNSDFTPLVQFMEKLEANPDPHSRQQLFRWLDKHHFGLAPDGDIIAYKGVQTTGFSKTSGGAFVNGVWVDGNVPNQPGTVISMPRSRVVHDPKVGCSVGLHVGNFRYASSFGPRWLRCKINPTDVVSVPSDSNDEKMRVCSYMVLNEVKAEDEKIYYVDAAVKKMARLQVESEIDDRTRPYTVTVVDVPRHHDDLPVWYEHFGPEEFDQLSMGELRAVAKTFKADIEAAGKKVTTRSTKAELIGALLAAQPARIATWPNPLDPNA